MTITEREVEQAISNLFDDYDGDPAGRREFAVETLVDFIKVATKGYEAQAAKRLARYPAFTFWCFRVRESMRRAGIPWP